MDRMKISILIISLFILLNLDVNVLAQEPQPASAHIKIKGRGTAEDALVPVYDVQVGSDQGLSDRFLQENPYTLSTPKPFFYKTDVGKAGAAAFLVAGVNCDSTLARADLTITGISIKELERSARPQHAPNMKLSNEGFILEDDSLRDWLLKDNRTVRSFGLTHQQVALPVLRALDAFQENWVKGNPVENGVVFKIDGQAYTVRGQGMMDKELASLAGRQDAKADLHFRPFRKREPVQERTKSAYCRSGWLGTGALQGTPFNDDLYTDLVIQITNPKGETQIIDGITPHMAYRYGFYQGNPKYRTDPKEIIAFFGLKKDPKDDPWSKCAVRNQ